MPSAFELARGDTPGLRGHIHGLTLSNNVSDATNDIDIAAGVAASTADNPVLMTLTAALTKRLDAAWAVGSGNGGLDTGSIANTTYHVWLIQRSDTGVVDALFSTSATAPTMPTNYDRKRRIGSIMRISATIRAFTQIGDVFKLAAHIADYSSTASRAEALLTLSVPVGIRVSPILYTNMYAAAGLAQNEIRSGSHTDSVFRTAEVANDSNNYVTSFGLVWTDTSARIYLTVTVYSGALSTNSIYTQGWFDLRGKDA
jgi:hypothetical protein